MAAFCTSISFETQEAYKIFLQIKDAIVRDLDRGPRWGGWTLHFNICDWRVIRLESTIIKNFKKYEALPGASSTQDLEGGER